MERRVTGRVKQRNKGDQIGAWIYPGRSEGWTDDMLVILFQSELIIKSNYLWGRHCWYRHLIAEPLQHHKKGQCVCFILIINLIITKTANSGLYIFLSDLNLRVGLFPLLQGGRACKYWLTCPPSFCFLTINSAKTDATITDRVLSAAAGPAAEYLDSHLIFSVKRVWRAEWQQKVSFRYIKTYKDSF